MSNNIEIDLDNDTFQMVSVTVNKTGKASELIKLMAAAEEFETPMLPDDCLIYKRVRNVEVYALFQPPSIETLGVTGRLRNAVPVDFARIPIGMPARITIMPFVNKVPFFRHMRFAFCSTAKREEIKSSTLLLNPWFPNTHTSIGKFCIGTGLDGLEANKTLATNPILACKAATRYMDTSNFNNHILEFVHWTDLSKLVPDKTEHGSFPDNALWLEIINSPDSAVDLAVQQLVRLNRITNACIKEVGEANAAQAMHNKAVDCISSRTDLAKIISNLLATLQ